MDFLKPTSRINNQVHFKHNLYALQSGLMKLWTLLFKTHILGHFMGTGERGIWPRWQESFCWYGCSSWACSFLPLKARHWPNHWCNFSKHPKTKLVILCKEHCLPMHPSIKTPDPMNRDNKGHFIKLIQRGKHGVHNKSLSMQIASRGNDPSHLPPMVVLLWQIIWLEATFKPIPRVTICHDPKKEDKVFPPPCIRKM